MTSHASRQLSARPLERKAFAAFGDVIETDHAEHYTINAGWAERYHDLATLDLTKQSGRSAISIFRALPRPAPVSLSLMERHQLSSQAFMPLSTVPFLIVVAPAGEPPQSADALSAFISNGRQGVNYQPGVWHHPLLAIDQASDFLIVDRVGDGENCDEVDIGEWNLQLAW